MTIRHALFIDGAWTDAGADSWDALVTIDEMGVEIRAYTEGDTAAVRFSFAEFAAIVELVERVRGQQEAQP